MGSIGDCCNDNQSQGPEAYLNDESIAASNLVLWYVAQMQTEAIPDSYYCWTVSVQETYPCPAGPMFVPVSQRRDFFPIFSK